MLQTSQSCYKHNMTKTPTPQLLTKRERQIMDVLYRLGRATATEIMAEVAGGAGKSPHRTPPRGVGRKGGGKHQEDWPGDSYMPNDPPHPPRQAAPPPPGGT